MRHERRAVNKRLLAAAVSGVFPFLATGVRAGDLDTIGITALRSVRPDLTGTGVSVGQAEATDYFNPNDPNGTMPYDPQFDANDFEFDPSVNASVTPTYVGKQGTTPTTTYTSSLGSGHASQVATNFFGTTQGAAPGVTADVEYNANYWFMNVVSNGAAIQTPLAPAGAPPVSVMNQSFVFGSVSANSEKQIDQLYDDYIANKGVIIVTAVGNSGAPNVPATAYNVIAVGDTNGATSVGPTSDGRSKPDISAPGGATSFSTPYVSGIAAVMVQAGQTGAGGTSSSTEAAAVDPRTVKALLMEGASKPAGWTHTTTAPLDPTYGAGIVNAYASYQTLTGGKRGPTAINTSMTPITGTTIGSAGFDLNTLTTPIGNSVAVSHYLLNITGNSTLSSVLTWNRPAGNIIGGNPVIRGINNFDLLLYNSAGTLVDSSVSTIDNVEDLYTHNLTAGTYDLEVVKRATNQEITTDTYGLAFNAMLLGDANMDGHVDLTDLAAVLNHMGQQTSNWSDGNFDGNSTIDATDLNDVLANFGATSGNLTAAVTTSSSAMLTIPVTQAPEPASLAVLGGVIPLLMARRRRA